MPITYAFVTSNEKKFAEYKLQLARYGREVLKLSPVKDDQKTVRLIWAYLLLTEEKSALSCGKPAISIKPTPGKEASWLSAL